MNSLMYFMIYGWFMIDINFMCNTFVISFMIWVLLCILCKFCMCIWFHMYISISEQWTEYLTKLCCSSSIVFLRSGLVKACALTEWKIWVWSWRTGKHDANKLNSFMSLEWTKYKIIFRCIWSIMKTFIRQILCPWMLPTKKTVILRTVLKTYHIGKK